MLSLGEHASLSDEFVPIAAAFRVNLHAREGFEARLTASPTAAALLALVLSTAQTSPIGGIDALWARKSARIDACAMPSVARFELSPLTRAHAKGTNPLQAQLDAFPALRSAAAPETAAGAEGDADDNGAWRLTFRAPLRDSYYLVFLRCASDVANDGAPGGRREDGGVAVNVSMVPLRAESPAALAALLAAQEAERSATAQRGSAPAAARRRRGLGLRRADESVIVLYAVLLCLVFAAFLLPWLVLLLAPARLHGRGRERRAQLRLCQALVLAVLIFKCLEYLFLLAHVSVSGGAPALAPSGWVGPAGSALLQPAAAAASAAHAARLGLGARLLGVGASVTLLASLFAIASGYGLVRTGLSGREREAYATGVAVFAVLAVLSATCGEQAAVPGSSGDDGRGGSAPDGRASSEDVCTVYELTFQVSD